MESGGSGSGDPAPVRSESLMEPMPEAVERTSRRDGSSRGQLRRYEEQLRTLIPGASGLPRIDLIHSAIDYISDLEEALQARVRKLGSSPARPPLTVLSSGLNAETLRPADTELRLPLSTLQTPSTVNTTTPSHGTVQSGNVNNTQVPSFSGFAEMFLRRNSLDNILSSPRRTLSLLDSAGPSNDPTQSTVVSSNSAAGLCVPSTSQSLCSGLDSLLVVGNNKKLQDVITSRTLTVGSDSAAVSERDSSGIAVSNNSKERTLLAQNDGMVRVKTSNTKFRKVIPLENEPKLQRVSDSCVNIPVLEDPEEITDNLYRRDLRSESAHVNNCAVNTVLHPDATASIKRFNSPRVAGSGRYNSLAESSNPASITHKLSTSSNNICDYNGALQTTTHTQTSMLCSSTSNSCCVVNTSVSRPKDSVGRQHSVTTQCASETVTATRGPDSARTSVSDTALIEPVIEDAQCSASSAGLGNLMFNSEASYRSNNSVRTSDDCSTTDSGDIRKSIDRQSTLQNSTKVLTGATAIKSATLTTGIPSPSSSKSELTFVTMSSSTAISMSTLTDSRDANDTTRYTDTNSTLIDCREDGSTRLIDGLNCELGDVDRNRRNTHHTNGQNRNSDTV